MPDDKRIVVAFAGEPLRRFVRRFLFIRSTAEHRDLHLPDTGFVAAFTVAGTCAIAGHSNAPAAALTGLWDTVRGHQHGRGHAVFLIAFTPLGAAAVLGCPLNRFANRTVDLHDVLEPRSELERLHEAIARAGNQEARVQLAERFLAARIAGDALDPAVSDAVSWLERSHGRARVDALARRVGLSERALERRFLQRVGIPPRRFASIVRVQHVARLQAAGHDFTTIAHTAGYCDQPHFNRDFKRITGVAPAAYFGSTIPG
jgi:AraC-like DNA-binding protein